MNFLRRVEDFHTAEHRFAWEGTFFEYLELVRQDPRICQLAHSRIYNMIAAAGIEEVKGQKRYRFFSRELFGLDRALEKLVEEYFHPAARRLDVRKRILLLMGPVSGGKSTLVNMLKRGLEEYSRTDEGAVFGIKGCPMHEEPLHLIPRELRGEFRQEYGISIEGELCPLCRLRLETEFNGRIKEVPVERILFSEEKRVGIGTFTPSDPKSQDIAELTGSIDFSTIAEFGSESDPRAYRFDGELNIANRGIMEFQEMLKCDERFLWNLLSLSQEGNFKAGRFALISADELIVAHSNETEYKAFVSNRKNEALLSRMIVMKIPYNLKVTDEVRIYRKLFDQSDIGDVHVAPHTLRAAAIFSVMSRLKESKKQGIDITKKMRLYDGGDIEGFRQKDLGELLSEHPDEGMSGVDPRYVINRLCTAIMRTKTRCISALDVLRALRDGFGQHPSITAEEHERILDLISAARCEYDEIAKREVQNALVNSFKETAQALFDNYLDNVEAYCNETGIPDPVTGAEIAPDERLMSSIEEHIGVTDAARRSFREEILIRLSSYARKGKTFDYTAHDRLREAIEKKLFAEMKSVIKTITCARTSDTERVKSHKAVSDRLVSDYGYCTVCAGELLRYVGSLLSR
ncbi:MAG: protein prkA [Bacillota bacterium]